MNEQLALSPLALLLPGGEEHVLLDRPVVPEQETWGTEPDSVDLWLEADLPRRLAYDGVKNKFVLLCSTKFEDGLLYSIIEVTADRSMLSPLQDSDMHF